MRTQLLFGSQRLALIALMIGTGPALGNEDDRKLAAEILETAITSIKSFEVYVTVEQCYFIDAKRAGPGGKEIVVFRVPDPKPSLVHSHQAYREGLRRVESLDEPKERRNVLVGDSSHIKSWQPLSYQCAISKPGFSVVASGVDYLETYYSPVGSFPLLYLLRERKNVRIDRRGKNLEVEMPPCPGENASLNGTGFRITMDASVSMLPKIMESYEIVDGEPVVSHRMTVVEYKQIDNGVFVPIKAIIDGFDDGKRYGFFKERICQKILSVDVSRSRWNTPLHDELFRIELPAGAKVIDEIRNVAYVTGKSDPGKNLDDLAKTARFVIKDIRPPLPTKPSRTWVYWSIGCGITVLLALGAVFLWHVRRKRIARTP